MVSTQFTKRITFRYHAMIKRMFLGIMILTMVLPQAHAGNNLCISSAIGFVEDGGMAIEAHLNRPQGIAVDKQGNIYIADYLHHRVRKIQNGAITTIAGTGVPGYYADDLPATSSKLNSPMDVAIDSQGNIYIADFGNHCIRKVNTDAMMSTFAGTGNAGFSGDGDFATSAQLNFPTGISIDSDDNLFIADMMNNRIRIVYSMTKKIDTFAGNGNAGFDGDGSSARSAMLNMPRGVFVDNKKGFVWIADTNNHRVRYVDTFVNVINTVAGNGTAGYLGDGNDAIEAQLNSPSRIVLDNNGNLYISDTKNNRVRKVDSAEPDGMITTYVGGGIYKTDNVHPSMANIDSPVGIVFDSNGTLYIVIAGDNLCRKVYQDSSSIITVAGIRNSSFETPPLSTSLHQPGDIFFDNENNAFIADTASHQVLKYDRSTGKVSPVAGNGEEGNDGNGNAATLARLRSPASVLVSRDKNFLYISEPENHWIRVVDFTQDPPIINIFAGDGYTGIPVVNHMASATSINYPVGLYHDKTGNIYFADRDNHCVYKINSYSDAERNIERVAGNTISGKSPDGTIATNASLNKPVDIWIDRFDNIFIADSGNERVCMVDAEGKIRTIMTNLLLPEGVAGNDKYLVVTDTFSHLVYRLELNKLTLVCPCDANDYIIAGTSGTYGGFSGDDGPSLLSRIGTPEGVAFDNNGDIFFADKENNRIRLLSEDIDECGTGLNQIKTIAGLFDLRGQALETSIREAAGVTTDESDNMYFSDSRNHRVVRIDAYGYIKSIAGNGSSGYSGDGDDATKAQLNSPQGLEYVNGVIYIADKGNHCIRKVDQEGIISTIAGNGLPGICETPAYDLSQSCLNEPIDIIMNAKGELFISDSKNHRIVKLINESDSLLLVAGTGTPGFSGDVAPAINASLNTPLGISLDMDENLMIADSGNNRVRIIYNDSDKYIDTYAGTGLADPLIDDTWADESNLSYPTDVAVDSFENVYISDSGHNRIRIVNNAYILNTFAGNGSADCSNENAISSIAGLNTPGLLAINSSDSLLVADQCHRIVQIEPDNSFKRIAGNSYSGFSGDDGPAKSAALNLPYDVATDQWNNIFVADKDNNRIRKISLDGTITTIAGNSIPGFNGDGIPAIYASLNSPHGVAVNMKGDIFITDTENNRVRVIWNSNSTIETIAGNGQKGDPFTDDDGLVANFVSLNAPKGIAVDSSGNIFFVDSGNRKVRKIDFESLRLMTIANYTNLGAPYGLAVDLQRNIYVSDILTHQVLKISPSLTVTPYAGDGTTDYFYTEEYKAAISASLYTPTFLDIDQASNLYILDTGHQRIRKVIELSRTIVTISGDGEPGFSKEGQDPIFASLNMPNGISVRLDGNILVADTGNHYIRKIIFNPFPSEWTVDTSEYNKYQLIRADALLNDNHIIRPGDKIAVFVGDECRGIGYPSRTPEGNQLFIVAWGNEDEIGQNMTLKYYRKNDNNIYEIEQSVQFQPETNDTLYSFDLKRTLECQDWLNQFTSYKLTLPTGWHLLSSFNADKVLIKSESICIGAIFEYNEDKYQAITPEEIDQIQQATLFPINGFWLKTTGECTVTVEAVY